MCITKKSKIAAKWNTLRCESPCLREQRNSCWWWMDDFWSFWFWIDPILQHPKAPWISSTWCGGHRNRSPTTWLAPSTSPKLNGSTKEKGHQKLAQEQSTSPQGIICSISFNFWRAKYSFYCLIGAGKKKQTEKGVVKQKRTRKSKVWGDEAETVTMLDELAIHLPQVGPMKKHKTRNDIWKFIGPIIAKKHGTKLKTVQQMISRYYQQPACLSNWSILLSFCIK